MARDPSAISGRQVAGTARRGFSLRFIGESYQELKRVTWPSREETTRLTIVVIAVAAAVGAFLSVVDLVFARIVAVLIGQ